ncbi:MAG TPA: DNA polymerase III subunit gamma/tau [Pyrinomonadaceae bacterium]|nr:DNA polymerase III subunit gamma/tau [Pyrinomonadaceae bacterium]
MSYQVIARKWRPQIFEEVTGQELITQTLKNAIEHDRLHHAYLFSGARGVGKTTTARLLAKALNCHKTSSPNVHPCRLNDPDPCVSCVEIAESRSMDVLEIDAASNTGIDNVRDVIIDGINIIPARDRYKIFIIDEVHQLSKPAFNALLKTLEEPPSNVVFIMATTELHKVPDTISSRTQQFEFRTIPLQKIYDRLKLIAEAEKIDVSDEALREIARSGDGSMRDAQSNFDQVISFAGERIEVADVGNALGLASVDMLTRVLDAIVENKSSGVLAVVDELSARGQDFRNFCRDLLGLFRDLLVTKVGRDASLVDTSMLSESDLKKRSELFSESDLVRAFHSLADTETCLKDATQPRYLLEIGLVKLVEMRRLASVESVLERLAELESSLEKGEAPTRAAAATAEKKTLKVEISAAPARIREVVVDPKPASKPEINLEFIDSLPVRLPPIPSEELEHVEDSWLDDAYERKLAWSGDDLSPIADVVSSLTQLTAETTNGTHSISISSGGSPSSAAVAIALAETSQSINIESAEMPQLGPKPTEQELLDYAKAHPAVRAAVKVFRGKIVKVKKPS